MRVLGLSVLAASLELTKSNWDEKTDGKTVLIKFFAPWCGHCKKMKPDWDNLMSEYEGHETALVADVDCTAEGKPLCDANGVKGFPTLKWGEPSALEDYEGGRDLETLKKFAAENLKPMCSVKNIDLCDDAKKELIEKYQQMDLDELKKTVDDGEKEMSDLEEKFKKYVEKLQKNYEKANKKKDKGLKEIKDSGLGLMKSILVARQKEGEEPKEEL